MNENVIEVKNLSKKYKDFELKNVSFNVPKGYIVGFIGENGAGKTTTIKSILNIINTEGEIKVLGLDSKLNEKEIKKDLGVVLDDSFLSDYLTVNNINKIMANFYDKWDEKKFFGYVEKFNLPTNKIIKNFSSGMKMKLKIATAISHFAKVLILDEPTSGLDPVVRSEILDIFRELIEEDGERAILMSTHITSDLESISDYLIFIDKGEIVFNLPTESLLENYALVKCSEDELKNVDKKDYIKHKKDRYYNTLLIENKKEFKKKYDIDVIDRPSIEDIMLMYIKGE